MQPTPSIWVILQGSGVFNLSRSIIFTLFSRARLMASGWAAPVGCHVLGGSRGIVTNGFGQRQAVSGRSWGAGVRHASVECRVSATIRLGAREPPRSGWVPANRHDPVGCPRTATIRVGRSRRAGAAQHRLATDRPTGPFLPIWTRYNAFPASACLVAGGG